MAPRKSRKKSGDDASEAPAARRDLLFSNLYFYFFPNSRSNRVRALRIDKSVEFGAIFCQQWNDKVTHIVMDDSMHFDHFIKYHKEMTNIPESVIVVNSRYITDCVAYGVLLSHKQKAYQVPGHEANDTDKGGLKRTKSEPTLAAKANIVDAKAPAQLTKSMTDLAPRTGTMLSEDQVENSKIVQRATESPSPISDSSQAGQRPDSPVKKTATAFDDELAAAIEEAKAMGPLVSSQQSASSGQADETTKLDDEHLGPLSDPADAAPDVPEKPVPEMKDSRPTSQSMKAPGSRPATSPDVAKDDGPSDPMIMKRPLDGKWVKLRCKECGQADFPDVREFLRHCAAVHRRRFKTKDEAIDECGALLVRMNKQQPQEAVQELAEDEEAPIDDAIDPDSGPEPETPEQPAKKRRRTGQENFACMKGGNKESGAENPNAGTIEKLQEMADIYARTNDQWRTLSFRRGITALKNQTKKITTKDEALKLPFVGESIAEAIVKIVQTGELERLNAAKDNPRNQTLSLFMGIYGVGLSQAQKWIAAGYKTLDDIREKAQLHENQKIGLDHYDDLQQRIPRREVEAHAKVVTDALTKIDPTFQITTGGSYRRGSETSGDIDLIITKPTGGLHEIRNIVLDQIVPHLFKRGFFTAELARTTNYSGSKWHGCSVLTDPTTGKKGPWRRIDLLLVPWEEMGAALIYFTGNDIFNRSIRLLASKKRMRLNQKGLYKDVLRGKGREKLTEGELLESADEKKIFEILGVPWRKPEDRNC